MPLPPPQTDPFAIITVRVEPSVNRDQANVVCDGVASPGQMNEYRIHRNGPPSEVLVGLFADLLAQTYGFSAFSEMRDRAIANRNRGQHAGGFLVNPSPEDERKIRAKMQADRRPFVFHGGSPITEPQVASQKAPPFPEHSLVRLLAEFETKDGRVAKGTLGTILAVFGMGLRYLVEFEGEHEPPEFVAGSLLEAADDARLPPPAPPPDTVVVSCVPASGEQAEAIARHVREMIRDVRPVPTLLANLPSLPGYDPYWHEYDVLLNGVRLHPPGGHPYPIWRQACVRHGWVVVKERPDDAGTRIICGRVEIRRKGAIHARPR